MTLNKATLPGDLHVQCPTCGLPVTTVEIHADQRLTLDCRHMMTLEQVRTEWGIETPTRATA